ncbi:MAG: DEAD/DEAH box helicase [Thermodesulfovibrionaceae bacterium]
MKKIMILKESYFSLTEGGKAYYVIDNLKVQQDLLESFIVDRRIPFGFLNPLQTVFYINYEKGNSLVSAPSSAGKSLIGYIFFLRNHKGGIKVYTAPTKSLVYEKVKEFKRYFETITVKTGDNILEFLRPVTSQVVVSTYENLVFTFRNKANWTDKIDCIIFDEIHHITKKWIVEEAVVYALEKNIPLVGLSATLPGVYELAEWMKCEVVIDCEWRPVPIEREIYLLKDFKEPIKNFESTDLKIASKIFNAMKELSRKNEKVLIFVPKKSLGWKLLEISQKHGMSLMNETAPFEIKSSGSDIAFHNADIPQEERYLIEKEFRNGSLNTLIATQTLAYGVNLPADRTLITIKGWFDVNTMSYRLIPDILDILQQEGRAGRLGIKEIGYSNWLIYGVKKEVLEKILQNVFIQELKTEIGEEKESLVNALSLWILIGFLYLGERYEDFLRKTFSFKEIQKTTIAKTEDFLRNHNYIYRDSLTEKGLFCIRSGIPPLNFEEFLRRLYKAREFSDILVVIRPLIYMKKFDSLFPFIENNERFEKDIVTLLSRVSHFGSSCINDNTHQFLFFTEGLTFYYPNIVNPPGEFSAMRVDALHMIRVLLELRKINILPLSNKEILSLAHTIKYGIPLGFSQIGALRRVGHIRGNLIRKTAQILNFKIPDFANPAKDLIDFLLTEKALKLMGSILVNERKISKEKAVSEIATINRVLKENINSLLIDKDILIAFGGFFLGPQAVFMRKEELIEKIFN